MLRNIFFSALITLGIFTIVVYSSCSKTEDSKPCKDNNTAIVSFTNRSANKTYTIVWDGSNMTTLGAGVTSGNYTVSAGIQHTLEFKYSNNSTDACTPSTPTLAQCSTINYFCGN